MPQRPTAFLLPWLGPLLGAWLLASCAEPQALAARVVGDLAAANDVHWTLADAPVAAVPDALGDAAGNKDAATQALDAVHDVPDAMADAADGDADLPDTADDLGALPDLLPWPDAGAGLDLPLLPDLEGPPDVESLPDLAPLADLAPAQDTAAPVDAGPPPPLACQPLAAQCPQAPPECNQAAGGVGAQAGKLTSVSAAGFVLHDNGKWASSTSLIAVIGADATAQEVTLDTVLGDLNRTATKISSHPDVPCMGTGYTWETGDQNVSYWIPQGIAGSATATPDGLWAGKKVSVVAWYHDASLTSTPSVDKGVRLAVVDATSLATAKYRLVLLAEPVTKAGVADLQAVKVHAGGIAWYKNWLYVADTSNGIRVFDWNHMLLVKTGQASTLGKTSTGYYAFDYKYVLPQVASYSLCGGSCCARFSFLEADLSTSPPSLLSGEYSVDTLMGRLHRWPLDPITGHLATLADTVHASQVLFPGVVKMQGAQSYGGQYFISSSAAKKSAPTAAGSLFHASVGGAIQTHTWPHHPEDFHYSALSDNLWCLTEDAGERAVFAVKMADLLAGCGK